jgi:hypothetical protein
MSLGIVVFGPWNFKCRLMRFQKTLGHVFVLGRTPPPLSNQTLASHRVVVLLEPLIFYWLFFLMEPQVHFKFQVHGL